MNTWRKFSIVSCIFLLVLLFSYQMQGQGSGSDPSLKLHYDFDEGFSNGRVIDVSSNGNDGLQFNPTNWITETNGVFGSTAAYFTTVGVMLNDPPQVYPLSQYIAVTNLNGIKYLTNATISVWARYDATNNGHNLSCLMDCGYTAAYAWDPSEASNSWTFAKLPFQNYLSFIVYPYLPGGGYSTLVTWPDDTVGGDNESTTNIHLYSVTIDCPGNQVIAYYDGLPYMTNAINLPWIQIYGTWSLYWENWLCIGASSHDGTPQWGDDRYPNDGYFSGKMDDVRIYNRTLPAAEIHALYLGYGSKAWNPPLTIRNAGAQSVKVSFASRTNLFYQVEYHTNLTAGLFGTTWTPLGSPILGNGGTNSVSDSTLGQTTRFYLVHPLP